MPILFILNSSDKEFTKRRVSVFVLLNWVRSNTGEEWTRTFLSFTEALGNLLISEKLPEPTSIFVEIFLLIELMKIFTTLSWRKRETQNDKIKVRKLQSQSI